MTKKTASTSNVPQTTSNNSNNSGKKGKSPQKNNSQSSVPNSGSSGVLNSKHLHTHSTRKIKPKTKRSDLEPSISDVNKSSMAGNGNGNDEDSNVLMKKLFEAVQKQKASDNSGKVRSRKGTAPATSNYSTNNNNSNNNNINNNAVPKTINSSETYAGAAFDRAPAATSFPIPSFVKSSANTGASNNNFSTSCPLPSGFETEKMPSPSSPSLKTLSISELFNKPSQTSSSSSSSEQNKLESLTNDLRKILNLR